MNLSTFWGAYILASHRFDDCDRELNDLDWYENADVLMTRRDRLNRKIYAFGLVITDRAREADDVRTKLAELAKICPVRLDDIEWNTPPIGIVSNAIYGYQSEIRELKKRIKELESQK